MAIEIKNDLRAAAIIDGRSEGGAGVIQIFGMTFAQTGPGVYVFTMDADVDPTQLSIYCSPGINELEKPRGRFISPTVLEVRSYTPAGAPSDCQVLFVEVHRYPGVLGRVMPPAPAIPTPVVSELMWAPALATGTFQGVSGLLYPWNAGNGSAEMTFPPTPANNALIGIKNVTTDEVGFMGFVPNGHDVEDPDTGGTTTAGYYLAASIDGGFGGSLALVIWRFSIITDQWHVMHAAKRASASVDAPP